MISKKVRTLETTLQKYRKFSKYKQLQLSFFIAMANKKFQLIRTFYNFFCLLHLKRSKSDVQNRIGIGYTV